MRVAIPHWENRISPVFDVAGKFLLIDIENGRESRREERRLSATDQFARLTEFLGFGAETLICGAISASAEARLAASGMQVIGFTCGKVDEVLAAYLNSKLVKSVFAMPGCQRWRRREGEGVMARGFGMGAGRGRGGGQRGGQGRAHGAGGIGGGFAAGLGGFCVCSKCGEKAPHTTGQPCLRMTCPKCGGPMTRT